jgi:hypothetical protein
VIHIDGGDADDLYVGNVSEPFNVTVRRGEKDEAVTTFKTLADAAKLKPPLLSLQDPWLVETQRVGSI